MDNPANNSRWKHTYHIVFIVGVIYILLLGLFTWLFNYPV